MSQDTINLEKISDLTVKLIGLAVFGRQLSQSEVDLLDEPTLTKIYQLSHMHDVTQIVAFALDKLGLLSGEDNLTTAFCNSRFFSVLRVEKAEYLYEQSNAVLSKAHIDYLPIKGKVYRDLYPVNYFRTSNDTDVLVKKSDLSRAKSALMAMLNLKVEYSTSHDVVLSNEALGHLELHHTLIESCHAEKASKLLDKVWDSAIKTSEYGYEMDKETTIFYHVAHMLKHTFGGGCGIKPFIDLKLLMDSGYDQKKLFDLVDRGGVRKFFDECVNLSEFWFGGGRPSSVSAEFSEYVVGAGVFGDLHNQVAVQEIKQGGRFRYLMSRVFMPYETLKGKYPSLEGKKWLTPLYWVRRFFGMLTSKQAKYRFKELQQSKYVDKERVKKIEKLMSDLDLF